MQKMTVLVMFVALVASSSVHSMQRAPRKTKQAAPKVAHKAPQAPKAPQVYIDAQNKYYPRVTTLAQAARRIQQHRTILKNLKHLPSREFAQKRRHEAFLNSMDDMLQLAQDVLKSASEALPEAKLESADALEIKFLALFNKQTPQLFINICALGTKKKNQPAARQQRSAH